MDNFNNHDKPLNDNQTEQQEIPGWEELLNEIVSAAGEIGMLRQALTLAKQRIDFFGKDQWITGSEAETLLQVSKRTLATMRKNNTVRYYHQNGKIYYKRHEIMSMPGCN